MHNRSQSLQYQYRPTTSVRDRPLHLCIILVSLLFIFLLVIESVAFIVLGTWHLIIPRLQTVLSFSTDIYRRELGFGILLVIIGSFGILISIHGLIAFFTLRLILLRIFECCLWFLMIIGAAVGIIGIIFAFQVDGFISQSNNPNVNQIIYVEETLMIGTNGGLALFMSSTLIVGIVMVRCLTDYVNLYSSNQLYV
ncbi:unnamed protein product [Rotaria socialis]|uniref:Uncharacterized protein n=3 Tax=Rotaria socialis TaxID=392032 RepID=A0A820URP1_9BILA|nr:unnamed protein product [Rotaria socialis]CAF3192166.1 unnamed protein product [Rotaria socialis]CAF3431066.1 unnamed protein product [Rotaria socialis]CAF4468930.1 unnamed protein product [Rotaria socialis]CAF4489280.1 unnamed protein product [Rotaria socialis]